MFSRKTHAENKLCVFDRVPSRGFCFPGKHTPKISYASLMKFLAGAFVFQENTTRLISYESLIKFLAGACVLGSVQGIFGVHLGGRTAI